MKKNILFFCLLMASLVTLAQENKFIVSGGYVFSNLEEMDENANGWRINGLFEYNPAQGKFAHGISLGYIKSSAESEGAGIKTSYKINNIPIYYAPKYLFGNESFKGFIKGAVGMHFSFYKKTAIVEVESNDVGFYGGAGMGIMKTFGEKIVVSLEYEWAYLSNSSYRDGFVNTVMAGVGFSF